MLDAVPVRLNFFQKKAQSTDHVGVSLVSSSVSYWHPDNHLKDEVMIHQARSYTEKRDFIRMPVQAPITLSQAGHTLEGVCEDLSSTGMQVVAATSFGLGDKVRVCIPSEHAELKGLEALTEVVRVDAQEDGSQRLGLTIHSMS